MDEQITKNTCIQDLHFARDSSAIKGSLAINAMKYQLAPSHSRTTCWLYESSPTLRTSATPSKMKVFLLLHCHPIRCYIC